jgi:hypothetical protein
LPAAAVVGAILVKTGTGLVGTMEPIGPNGDEGPPPGPGLLTPTLNVGTTGVGVGASVGVGVGATVGLAVGASVGAIVGIGVGASVGTGVGASVGTGVGASVGFGVGAAVGTGDGLIAATRARTVKAIAALPAGGGLARTIMSF